jgi:hypothetical protein
MKGLSVRNGEMPVYFFGLPDDLALPEVSEELANDAEARQVAQIVLNDLSRDRYDGEQVAVLVFNNSGQLIHKVWTWPPAAQSNKKNSPAMPGGLVRLSRFWLIVL